MQEKTYRVSKGSSIAILVILCLLQLSDWADRSILNISLQAIKTAFNLTDAQAGMLPAMLQIGVAVFLIPAAVLSDRFARRKVIMVMSSIWSIFTIVTGLATQMWHLFLARFMVGSSEGGYQPAGQTWLGLTFPKEIRTRILAVFMMCVPIGVALGLFVGGALLNATHDWRTAFFVFGVPGLILAVVVLFLPDYKVVKQEGEAALSRQYFRQWGDLFKIKTYWLFIISTTFLYFMSFAMQAWVPTMILRSYPDMNTLQVGTAMGAVGLLNLVAPLGGILADRWQARNRVGRPLFLIIIVVLGSLAIFASASVVGKVPFQSWLPIYILTVLIMAFMTPIMNVLVHDVTPVAVRATAVGIMLAIAQVGGGVLGPIFVGAVSDATGGGGQGIINGMLWTIPVGALSIIPTLILLKYYAKDSAKISDTVMAER
jgi:MFS transporter, Spinster family, sphingosine-1-phosphate transporter